MWAQKIPLFTEEIKRIFTAEELNRYFATTTGVGSAAHVATDEEYELMRNVGMFDDDVISSAADAILFERARFCSVEPADLSEALGTRMPVSRSTTFERLTRFQRWLSFASL